MPSKHSSSPVNPRRSGRSRKVLVEQPSRVKSTGQNSGETKSNNGSDVEVPVQKNKGRRRRPQKVLGEQNSQGHAHSNGQASEDMDTSDVLNDSRQTNDSSLVEKLNASHNGETESLANSPGHPVNGDMRQKPKGNNKTLRNSKIGENADQESDRKTNIDTVQEPKGSGEAIPTPEVNGVTEHTPEVKEEVLKTPEVNGDSVQTSEVNEEAERDPEVNEDAQIADTNRVAMHTPEKDREPEPTPNVNGDDMETSEVYGEDVKASEVNGDDVKASEVNGDDVKASEVNGDDVKASEVNDDSPQTSRVSSPSNKPNLNKFISEVVSKRMKDEEEKLLKLNEEKEEEETKAFQEEWEKAEEAEKEEKYKKLQLLLTKSELYTKYLLERMEQQKPSTADVSSQQPPAKKARLSRNSEDGVKTSQESQASKADMALRNGCPLLFEGTLRPYQVDGLVWLNTMFENGVNGILADEMGLGKTIQCIASIAHLITMDIRGPFLIIVPLSTLPNWVNEFKRFAPKVPVLLYHGNREERQRLRPGIHKSVQIDGQWWCQPVVCTSYDVAMKDRRHLMSMNWKYLIVDEGHRIKNAQCRLIKELRLYETTHRVLLTGTPLQNNLSELWSLLNFLLPEVFDDLDSFEYWFKLDCLKKDQQDQLVAEEKKMNILAMLHKIMTPFILRRLKTDVELNLPPKQELMVYAPLTQQQRVFYEATVDKTIFHLLGSDDEKEAVQVKESPSRDPTGRRQSRRGSGKAVDYKLLMSSDNEDDDESSIDGWVKEIMEMTENRVRDMQAILMIDSDSDTDEFIIHQLIEDEEDARYELQQMKMSGPFELDEKSDTWCVEHTRKGQTKKQKKRTHANNLKMQYPMMQLKKCCCHPYLLSQPIDETGYCKIDEDVINASGKMLLMDAMLGELKRTGHKVLIFSQMTKMLDLIEDYCHIRRYEYCRLDGNTSLDSRREQMELFNSDPDHFLFLLSTRAGGLGINLCAADTVIIYDSDWNPQCDLQAQDRAHRIGQTKPVMVYRLVCANTIDQRVVERAARKRVLERIVIHKEKFKTGMTKTYAEECKSLSPQELLQLLRSDNHDAVVSAEGRKEVISRRELNALLDRSALFDQWQDDPDKDVKSKKSRKKAPKEDMSRVFKVIDDGRQSPGDNESN